MKRGNEDEIDERGVQYEGVIWGAGTCSAPGPSWTALHCALERENVPSSPETAPGRPGSEDGSR